MEHEPEVKNGDAMLEARLYTADGKTSWFYRFPSYAGNVPHSVRQDFGGELLRLLTARFGTVVRREEKK